MSKAKPTRISERPTVTHARPPTKRVTRPKYPAQVGTFDDLISNFRDLVAKVSEGDREYEIATTFGEVRYVVFGIKLFNKKVDAKKTYLSIGARQLKDKPSTVFGASRNLMFNVVITYNNIPRYIIEPRRNAAAMFLAAKLEIEDVEALCAIIKGGSLIDLLELVPAEVEEARDNALKEVKRKDKLVNDQKRLIKSVIAHPLGF